MSTRRLFLRPPTHKIDAPGVFISTLDCWDTARIEADIANLEAAELAKQVAEAEAAGTAVPTELGADELEAVRKTHPYVRYQEGLTRYQLDADDWLDGKPACARDFLTEGEVPVEFVLRRLPYKDVLRIQEMSAFRMKLAEFVRHGVVEIRGGDGGLAWKRKDRELVPEQVMQALHDAECLLEVGLAVTRFASGLGQHEGKR